MSVAMVRKCDECGAVHGAVNNWWCVVGFSTEPTFVTFETAEQMVKNKAYAIETLRLDYCSHKCIGTAFNRWLDTGDVRAATPQLRDEELLEETEYAATDLG